MSGEKWCLEDIWVNLMIIEQNSGKLTFTRDGDLHDMVVKCRKIMNKALAERNRVKK